MLNPQSTPDAAPRHHAAGLGVLLAAAAVLGGGVGHYWGSYPAGTSRDRLDFDAANVWAARRNAVHSDLARALGAGVTGAATGDGQPPPLRSVASDSVLWIGQGLLFEAAARRPAADSVAATSHARSAAESAANSITVSPLPALAVVGTPPRPTPRLDLGLEPGAGPGLTRGALARGEADGGGEVGAAPVSGVEGPRYPAALRDARLTGDVVARFVVDTAGRVVPASFDVLDASHPAFTAAVRDALGRLRYLPAESGGRRVEQTVQQTFHFAPKR